MALRVFPSSTLTKTQVRSSVAAQIVSPYVFYRMHEGTGTSLADSSPNSGPAIAVGDTTTNLWTSPYFGVVFDVLGNYAFGQDAGTIIDRIFNLSRARDNGQIIVAFDYSTDGTITSSEQMFSYGANTTAGYWGINVNTTPALEFSHRGVGASNLTTTAFPSFNLFTNAAGANSVANARITLLFDLRVNGTSASCTCYSNGTSISTASVTDLFANSATDYPGATTTQPLVLFARKTSTGGSASGNFDRKAGAGGSSGRMGLFFAMRRTTASTTLAQTLATQFTSNQGEWPLGLIGA